ncbi:TVP38/TMEM64 family protein [Salinimicrobium tongyeongense]|uniref:TVP38/TMEM64 family membrane protein n=1 Tax=Salinimicrobium tongyeongense TaxID=2809707 RepID=A0ABY6NRX4_9FLAO|nr:TVP38/TMEM64 family protein [Salinimicrobium tongyeongense]UZH55665.1 TVP38/TMEM64 family protein [Salinimicrobium tongyeongense]
MSKSFFQKYLSFFLSGSIILFLVILYFTHSPFQESVKEAWEVLLSEDRDRIKDYVKQFGIWGPLAIVVFIVLQMFLIIFPSWLPIIVGVLAYGFWIGVLINLIGIGLASTIGYYIGKKFKNVFVSDKKYEKMKFWIENYSFGTVVLFRVSPFFSTDAISFIAGIFRMNYKKFMLATYSGMIPLTLAVGYFSTDIDKLENGLYWVGGAGAVLYAIYVYIDYHKRRKKNAKQ